MRKILTMPWSIMGYGLVVLALAFESFLECGWSPIKACFGTPVFFVVALATVRLRCGCIL